MRYLNARPAKLEDDDEHKVVGKLQPIISFLASQTHVEDEGETKED